MNIKGCALLDIPSRQRQDRLEEKLCSNFVLVKNKKLVLAMLTKKHEIKVAIFQRRVLSLMRATPLLGSRVNYGLLSV